MAGKTIRIKSDTGRGFTPVHVNGIGRDIPHNQDVAVTDGELAVLEDSHVAYTIVGDAKASDVKAAKAEQSAEPSKSLSSQQQPGADFLPTAGPVDPGADVRAAPKINQVPGGDNLSGGVIHGAASNEAADEDARQAAADKAQAARDGTLAPTVELRNTDPHQLGLDANNPEINGEAPPVALSEAAREASGASADPLDHDDNGKKGGSKKGAASTRATGARRARASAAKKPASGGKPRASRAKSAAAAPTPPPAAKAGQQSGSSNAGA